MRNQETAEASEEQMPPVVFEGGYQIPGKLYDKLFDYQKTGWLPISTNLRVNHMLFRIHMWTRVLGFVRLMSLEIRWFQGFRNYV